MILAGFWPLVLCNDINPANVFISGSAESLVVRQGFALPKICYLPDPYPRAVHTFLAKKFPQLPESRGITPAAWPGGQALKSSASEA